MSLTASLFETALTVIAVAFGFGCAAGIATLSLRALVGVITRNTYNVNDVPDGSATPV